MTRDHLDNESQPGHTLSLFVFVDALGWELVKQYAFLEELLPNRSPLGTIFGYSSTCEPTILTGKLPRDHGHFAFFTRANGKTPFRHYWLFKFIPRFLTNRGRVRNFMSKHLKRLHGITGYFQIYNMPFEHLHRFDYTEKRDMFEPGGIIGGLPTIFDYLEQNEIAVHRSDWRKSETENLESARHALDAGHVRFAYVYLASLDADLHNEGKSGEGVAQKLAWYEREIRGLYETACKRYGDVRLFVYSDHGMTETIAAVPLMQRIESLGLTFGEDYLAVYDSTMARFWFEHATARNAIAEALAREPHGRILSHEELAAWGCDFPGDEYGELFFLLDPGYLLCPSFMGEKPLAGMHGYDPDHEDSVAAFMTNAGDIAKPRRLDDIYTLMRREVEPDVNPVSTA
jgi:hypothetical protein